MLRVCRDPEAVEAGEALETGGTLEAGRHSATLRDALDETLDLKAGICEQLKALVSGLAVMGQLRGVFGTIGSV